MNKFKLDWMSFFCGACIATWICIIIYAVNFKQPVSKVTMPAEASSEINTESEEATVKSYVTNIVDWTIPVGDKTLSFNTPKGFYSLTDQYLENLAKSYGVDSVDAKNMIVVGDSAVATQCTTLINANKLSEVQSMLKQIYGESYTDDSVVEAESYVYMKTGKLPEELPLNYNIEEVAKYTVDGMNYVVYDVSYDTEYEVDEDEDESTAPVTETIKTQQLTCYSKNEDTIEIVLYQSEFNKELALEKLEEFLGVDTKSTTN